MDHEVCAACDFDGWRYDAAALLAAIRALGPQWRELLAEPGNDLRRRPAPETWSAIEYAAHSRDITRLHAFGVEQALTTEEPVFPAVDSGLADVAAEHYNEEDTAAVIDALDGAALQLASLAENAGEDAWSRGLTIGTDRSSVHRLLEHALHDSTHHLRDVEIGFVRLR